MHPNRHPEKLEVRVSNLDCEHDAATIQRGMRTVAGVLALRTYPKAAKVVLTYDRAQTSPETLKRQLQSLGFPPQQAQQGPQRSGPPALWRNPKVVTSALSGLLLLLGWLLGLVGVPPLVSTVLYLASLGLGGYFFWTGSRRGVALRAQDRD